MLGGKVVVIFQVLSILCQDTAYILIISKQLNTSDHLVINFPNRLCFCTNKLNFKCLDEVLYTKGVSCKLVLIFIIVCST